jgi:hypothetical protein
LSEETNRTPTARAKRGAGFKAFIAEGTKRERIFYKMGMQGAFAGNTAKKK